MEAISLALRDHTGRNLDGPRLVDAPAESTRSPCLFFVFPANRKAFSTTIECFFYRDAARNSEKLQVPAVSSEHSRVIIGIDGTRLPPLAASPNARRARCCE